MEENMGVLVIGIMITVCALGFSVLAYLRSVRSAEPDQERLRQFIESAPMDRLKPVRGDEPETPQHETDGAASDDRGQDRCGTRRVFFRLMGTLSVEFELGQGPASGGCNCSQRNGRCER